MNYSDWLSVSGLIEAYCEANRYPVWRFKGEFNDAAELQTKGRRWREGLISALAPYHEAILFAHFFEADWGKDAHVWLSQAEAHSRLLPISGPSRNLSTFELIVTGPWSITAQSRNRRSVQPVRLRELLETEWGTDALIHRLEKKLMPPYTEEEIAAVDSSPRWIWAGTYLEPICLLLASFQNLLGERDWKVQFPQRWQTDVESEAMGPLYFPQGRLPVVNDQGLGGLIDRDGYFVVPCRYAYFDKGIVGKGYYEVGGSLVPESDGEMLCDVIDSDGKRINPPGLRVLAGTLTSGYCVVTSERMLDGVRRKDVMRLDDGRLLIGKDFSISDDDLRWSAVWDINEGRRPVRSPDDNRWGYVDAEDVLIIPPQFHKVGHFDQGRALAWMEPEKVGMIDRDGNWVIAPRWRNIWPKNRRFFIVQDEHDRFGAVDMRDQITIPPRSRNELMAEFDAAPVVERAWRHDESDETLEERIVEWIADSWHRQIRLKVKAAKASGTLAVLEGIFDEDATQSDLAKAGVWHLPVEVIRDQTTGILQPKAGETGFIACYYPVTLSIFDLSIEAPVCGLAVQPNAAIGVPWRDLAARVDT